jgi:nifR3 family TIM-barrel protein
MISARAVVEGNAKTMKLTQFADDESPRSLQLAAVDPVIVGEAIRKLIDTEGIDHFDLNLGCPVRKVTRNGGGSALPYKRRLLRKLLGSAVDAAGDVPVTIKFRVGIDDDHMTHLDTGQIASEVGIAAVALHGRTAAQLYSGTADWTTIAALREALPAEIPVYGNGDIWEASDALAMVEQTGCDGVVIGRGCLGRPWLFAHLDAAFAREPLPEIPRTSQVALLMAEHAKELVAWFGEYKGVREFRKHTAWYLKGYPIGGEIRRQLGQIDSLDQLDILLAQIPDVSLPQENRRVARGHTRGPQIVALPEHWLDDPDDDLVANPEGGSAASGG